MASLFWTRGGNSQEFVLRSRMAAVDTVAGVAAAAVVTSSGYRPRVGQRWRSVDWPILSAPAGTRFPLATLLDQHGVAV